MAKSCKLPEDLSEATGMTVRLKSGGPLMTILDVDENQIDLECGWFSNDGQFREAKFSVLVIEAVRKTASNA